MFRDKDEETAEAETALYTAGTYSSTVTLNDMALNLVVVVDKNHINKVSIENIDESIAMMYPLLEPSLDAIAMQLYDDVPLEQVELSEDKKYTQQLLLDAIAVALEKAKAGQ